MDNICSYINELTDEDLNAYEDNVNGDREEWMYLAELNTSRTQLNDENVIDISDEYWQSMSGNYTEQQVASMPAWLENQKKSYPVKYTDSVRQVDIAKLNIEQNRACQIVLNHYTHKDEKQLLMIITGLAGSGKSYLIDAIRNLLEHKCVVCSYFGTAPFNVKGRTLHSFLTSQLPVTYTK